MSHYLNKTGRHIVFGCEWAVQNINHGVHVRSILVIDQDWVKIDTCMTNPNMPNNLINSLTCP